ncbi:MAG: universal stress protein, partial [Melioribacteraceae bacterium]
VEINETAAEEDIDLIIIATHGHTGMEHLLFGSTAEKVVRKAPCPVLTLREPIKGFKFSKN